MGDAARPTRRRLWDVLRELRRPKVGLMLMLGFSSGLPFMLIGNTLGFWLAEDHIKLAAIGFVSWIGLAYSWKFLWGAVVDHVKAPLIGTLGRRRGWMIIAQVGVAAGLIGMAGSDPKTHLAWLTAWGLLAGISAAAQDTVIDAWRIESASDADEQGLLTAAYSLGFRGALICTEAVILVVAEAIGWPLSYGLYAALMLVGIIAALLVKEPARADAVMDAHEARTRLNPLRGFADAVIGPLAAFFRVHGLGMAALMLAMISFYHLCDYMRGPMTNPYYVALGIPKPTIAAVRASIGLIASVTGIALGGLSCLRLGNVRTLVLGTLVQPIAVGTFALLGWHGGDFLLASLGPVHVSAFAAIMAFDGIAMGYAGVALVAYMSTLTSLGYTATQYALLTSFMAFTGKTLKGFSGALVEHLQAGRSLLDAYALFYLVSAAIGLPAILLCVVLAVRRPSPPVYALEPYI
jgi:PAT family beta-lactamase induction signal transducer AmpG